jgi:putative tricarboxylic transport membrane protein
VSEGAAAPGASGRWSGLALSLLVAGLGLAVILDGAGLRGDQGYARVGPAVFPYAVGIGLIAIGGLLAVSALAGRFLVDWTGPPEAGQAPRAAAMRQLGRAALALAGLLLNVVLLQPAGFVVAATILFGCTATAFGAPVPRAFGYGLALAGAIYLAFGVLLGLDLPAGRYWSGG